jgi:hypothetical protein
MHTDGGRDERVLPVPILDFLSASPDGRFVVVGAIGADQHAETHILRSADAVLVWRKHGYWPARWSSDGRTFYQEIGMNSGVTQTLAKPASDAGVPADPSAVTPDATKIQYSLDDFFPSADAATYVFVNEERRQNIFRIPLH